MIAVTSIAALIYLALGLVVAIALLVRYGVELADEWRSLRSSRKERVLLVGCVIAVASGAAVAWPSVVALYLLTRLSD
ncbi:MAG: hypothetical protein AAF170_08545 [Bacteroidota bacterium]